MLIIGPTTYVPVTGPIFMKSEGLGPPEAVTAHPEALYPQFGVNFTVN